MKLSQQTQAAATVWADNNRDLFAFLSGISVEFNGPGGDPHDNFYGSGVVVRVTEHDADIVTAKHNLGIASKGKPRNQAVQHFIENIKARLFDADGVQVASAPVTLVHVPDGQPLTDNGYDVAVMRVSDQAFCQRVLALTGAGGPGQQFCSEADLKQGWVIHPFGEYESRAVLTNGRPEQGQNVEYYANWELVQMGYGDYSGGQHGFRFRVLQVNALQNPKLIPATHDGVRNVFTFNTDATNTAATGDSGGPIFAINPAKDTVNLIGLHSGANYFANSAEDVQNAPTQNNAFCRTVDELTMPE